MPSNNSVITSPSICIPRTLCDQNTNWRRVKEVFEAIMGKGTVDRVDIVKRRDDNQPFCRIFVHMRYWPIDKPDIAEWRETLLRGDSIKVVHSAPWFWKCVASNLPRPESRNNASVPYVLTDTTPSPAAVAASTRVAEQHEHMADAV
jgi:hypothetical protein